MWKSDAVFLCSCREKMKEIVFLEGFIMDATILSSINSTVFGVWFLIGAALVFWMQAGFAMV